MTYKLRGRNSQLVHTLTFAINRQQLAYVKQRCAELKMKPPEFMRQMIDNAIVSNPTVRDAEDQRQEQLESNHGWTAHIPMSEV